MKLLISAPAKINLSLDVLYKRPDDYHEVEMVMTSIDLVDQIELTLLNSDDIKISSENKFVPNDERNLAYQAAHLLKKRFSIKEGVAIKIEKNIPIAAGLAGGSTDAAAVLRGLNELWNLGLSLKELAEIGSEIGSDIPFCVYGGTALATGRGEIITKLPTPPQCWVVLAKPQISVSTAEIYRNLQLNKIDHPNTKQVITALQNNDYRKLCRSLENVLETVTFNKYPEVAQLKEKIASFGADAVLMSGSGPTVFGLVQYESRLQRIYNGLRGFTDEVYVVRLLGNRHELD